MQKWPGINNSGLFCMIKCASPLVIQTSAGPKGRFLINLNTYRNAHYRMLNNAKIMYKRHMTPQIEALPSYDRLFLQFVLYPGSAREMDLANIASVTEKFFCDALVELGKLPDDNYKHLIGSCNTFGEIDRMNPRMEILFNPPIIHTGVTP